MACVPVAEPRHRLSFSNFISEPFLESTSLNSRNLKPFFVDWHHSVRVIILKIFYAFKREAVERFSVKIIQPELKCEPRNQIDALQTGNMFPHFEIMIERFFLPLACLPH